MILPEHLQQRLQLLEILEETGLNTYGLPVSSGCGPTMVVKGRECINLISNSYMGFSVHPKVKEAALAAIKEYGVGIGGSPVACGNTVLHERLCEIIAENYQKPACMLFATGYQALAGTIQGILTRKDLALLDSLDHRSIIDGCALAGCKVRSFVHNDVEDLARLVKTTSDQAITRMVIVDSVYSMDGDIAPLPQINEICRPKGVLVCIDEAHSLGVMGKTGRGLLEHFDLPDGADLISGTFSKFAGAVGGFLAGPKEIIRTLKVMASPFVFSASLPPVLVAAVTASFELLRSEPEWHQRLWDNVHFMLNGLKELGFDTGSSCTPVIPVMIRDTQKVLFMNRRLLDLGVYASPVVHPGVPLKRERLRLGVMASHTRQHLQRALEAFRKAGQEAGVID